MIILPVAILVAVITYVLFKYTKLGFEIKMIGDNKTAADYAGIKTDRKIITSMLMAGAIAGLMGFLYYFVLY